MLASPANKLALGSRHNTQGFTQTSISFFLSTFPFSFPRSLPDSCSLNNWDPQLGNPFESCSLILRLQWCWKDTTSIDAKKKGESPWPLESRSQLKKCVEIPDLFLSCSNQSDCVHRNSSRPPFSNTQGKELEMTTSAIWNLLSINKC